MRLEELRRNPDLNTRKSIINQLLDYKNQDVYISFQNIQKLGINPKFNFSGDALGIYAYKLDSVIDDIVSNGNIEDSLPFASERSYIFIFTVNPSAKILYVKKYNNNDLKTDLMKLHKIINDTYQNVNDFLTYVKKINVSKYPFGILMNSIRILSNHKSITMRKMFIDLGYDGVVDEIGDGALNSLYKIKESVFFNISDINIVEMITNHNPNTSNKKDVEIDPFGSIDRQRYTQEPAKKQPMKTTGEFEVIDPGLTTFQIGDFITKQEYEQNKEYGLTIK